MPYFRYSRWDGAQQVFELDGEDVMEQLSEHLVNHSDISKALESLAKGGLRTKYGEDVPGVDEILSRLRAQEQEILDRYNLDHVLEDIEGLIRRTVEAEKAGIDQRLARARERLSTDLPDDPSSPTREEMAKMLGHLERMSARNRETLDHLPSDPAGAIERLSRHEFADENARSGFEGMMASLKQQMLSATFKGMMQGLGDEASKQVSGLKQMLQGLNDLFHEHLEGSSGSSRSMFDRFMQEYGRSFGLGDPSTIEELADGTRRRMAQMDLLLQSLPAEFRRKLEEVIRSVLQDDDLHREIARLSDNLQRISPMPESAGLDFRGMQDAGLEQALNIVSELHELGELRAGMLKAYHDTGSNIDIDLLRKHLGEEACQAWDRMQSLEGALERSGYLRAREGRLELTPKGVRKIGQRALQEIFGVMRKERAGAHQTAERGGGDPSEDTRPYLYGDPFNLHLQRTMLNAVMRSPGLPVALTPEDFEVQQLEQVSQSSTVLLLDLSLSMATRGNFPAAKKVTLALDNLIRTQFPHDSLHVVGFSTYAREVKPEQVAELAWDQFDPYTNIQHGLSTARKLLATARGSTRQIIMISDGEPTAHTEGDELFCQYPPDPRTVRETLKEVRRCARQGITINMFMLDRNSSLVQFVSQMNKINRGKVFYTSPTKLGEYILVDYLTSRRKLVA